MPVSRPIAPLRPFIATATKTLCVTFVLLLLSIYSIAQSTSGRVLGSVTDQTGAAVRRKNRHHRHSKRHFT